MPQLSMRKTPIASLFLFSSACSLLFTSQEQGAVEIDAAENIGDAAISMACDSTTLVKGAKLLGAQALDINCDGSDEVFLFVEIGATKDPQVWIRDGGCPSQPEWAQHVWLPNVELKSGEERLTIGRVALKDADGTCDSPQLVAIGQGASDVWLTNYPISAGVPADKNTLFHGTREISNDCNSLPPGPFFLETGNFDRGVNNTSDLRDDIAFSIEPNGIWRYKLEGNQEPDFTPQCGGVGANNIPDSLKQANSTEVFGILRLQGVLPIDEILEVGASGLLYWRENSANAFSAWSQVRPALGAAVRQSPIQAGSQQLAAVAWNNMTLAAKFVNYTATADMGELIFAEATIQFSQTLAPVTAGVLMEMESEQIAALLIGNQIRFFRFGLPGPTATELFSTTIDDFLPKFLVARKDRQQTQLHVFSENTDFQCLQFNPDISEVVPCD